MLKIRHLSIFTIFVGLVLRNVFCQFYEPVFSRRSLLVGILALNPKNAAIQIREHPKQTCGVNPSHRSTLRCG